MLIRCKGDKFSFGILFCNLHIYCGFIVVSWQRIVGFVQLSVDRLESLFVIVRFVDDR